MQEATPSADAFAAEAGTVPAVVNSGADAPAAIDGTTISYSETDNPRGNKFYTEEDLAKVRSQEKDKLYPQIESLKEEVLALKKDKEDKAVRKAAEEAEKTASAEAAKRAKEESEMDVRDLLKTKEQEWNEQLERERQERERAFALLEREKNFAELNAYRQSRVEAERESIIPELIDLVIGESQEEIEKSITGLKERSSRILESAQSAMQAARRDMTGTRVTSPQAGPLDINTGNRQFTADEISSMSMNDYAKYRQQLLSDNAQGRSKGLFS
jgi:hypothetical protein